MSDTRAHLTRLLQERFHHLNRLLYDTSVPTAELDAELSPYLDENVRFVDPWQTGTGRDTYRLGAAGFHTMFRFRFEEHQLSVSLDSDLHKGRAMVDGVMHLEQLAPLFTFPLRTMLVYDFIVTSHQGPEVRFLIQSHEEMWSVGDMLAAVPGLGWFYRKLFRPAFSVGFLTASRLAGATVARRDA